MSIVTMAVTLAMLLWAVWFVAKGLSHGVRLLRRPSGQGPSREERVEREIGVVLLVGVVGVLVGTALFVVVLVTQRESQAFDLRARIAQLEDRVKVYEDGVGRLERAVEAGAREGRASGDRLDSDVRQGLSDLRKRLAGQQ